VIQTTDVSHIEPEFSRAVQVDAVTADGLELEIAATPAERAELARRLGLEELRRLHARVRVVPQAGRRWRLHVDFVADVLQSCVVTLEPVSSVIDGQFDVSCIDEADGEVTDVFVEPEGEEPPEPIVDGQVDVGELLVQQLALAIDPYPRRADASVPAQYSAESRSASADGADEDAGESPFAALAALKQRRDGAGRE